MGDVEYLIEVKTGDKLFSGTDANVYVRLHCNNGQSSEEKLLDNFFVNDLETGQINQFKLKRQAHLKSVDFIDVWRDDVGILDNWYVDHIKIKNSSTSEQYEFPVYRWIKAGYRYRIPHLDTSLPQSEQFKEQRSLELEDKRTKYELTQNIDRGPAQVNQ